MKSFDCIIIGLILIIICGCKNDQTNLVDDRDKKIILNENSSMSIKDHFSSLKQNKNGTSYSIDRINGKLVSQLKQPIAINTPTIQLSGWAIDKPAIKPGHTVYFLIGETPYKAQMYGINRPDVAKVHKSNNFVKSGFKATIPTKHLKKGKNDLKVYVVSHDELSKFKPNPKKLISIEVK